MPTASAPLSITSLECALFPERLLPPSVVVRSSRHAALDAVLFASEQAAMANAIPRRVAEFSAGRACARDALAQLGAARVAIPVGARRQPLWPPGFVGSITHTACGCAAAVARVPDVNGVGIDIEQATALAPGLIERIATPEERSHFRELPDLDPGQWAKIAFSAKESAYKAYTSITGSWLDFHDLSIRFEPERSLFRIELVQPNRPPVLGRRSLEGRFHYDARHVYTAVTL